jgi:hypothetical protein
MRFTEFLSSFRRKIKISKDKREKKVAEMLNVKTSGIETLKAYITSMSEDIQEYFSSIFFPCDISILHVFYFRYFYFSHKLDKSKPFKLNSFGDF